MDTYRHEIIVAGGGFTGVAAAVAAAREGRDVLLVEKSGFLGGAATNCLVNPFMNYFCKDMETGESTPINRGFFEEILNELKAMGGLHENKRTFNEEYLKIVLDRLCAKYNVKVLLHTIITDVIKEGDRITYLEAYSTGQKLKLAAECFIDASGDANLAALAGCDFQLGREEDGLCQPMTLCLRIANITAKNIRELRPYMNEMFNKLQAEGKIKNPRENILFFEHMSEGVIHFNTTRIIKKNPTNPFDLSYAEAAAREQGLELLNFLKEYVPGFENATLIMTAAEIGVRESRKVIGEYVLQAEDLLECKQFEDSVARGAYEVDIHNPSGTGTVIKRLPEGKYYTIPYRSLVPLKVSNMLVAGRCISSSHEAQSAYRVIPIVCCIGEGAGTAAAVFVENKNGAMKEVDIKEAQRRLTKHNALY